MLNIFHSVEELKRVSSSVETDEIRKTVLKIIQRVKTEGDQALYDLTERLDKVRLSSLRISDRQLDDPMLFEDKLLVESLLLAAENIRSFHQKQKRESWLSTEENGSILGQLIQPIERIGVYVPGGTAAYPSSVLMNVIPAQVAGVNEIVMVTPPNENGAANPYVLLAAKLLGINEIYTIGGAQGIAAMAYGTETIKKVDKIVGPGNIYVAIAKREVFGQVGIDMVAGPSEIVIVADEKAQPKYICADLLSQAEHDKLSSSILITDSPYLVERVQKELEQQLLALPRKEIAETAIKNHGGIILVDTLEEAICTANTLAPEHLELLVAEPFSWLSKIKNAGAIFMGEYSSEPVGDYFAGPNHVLPTSGTARFSSPLNVDDFMKKSSIIFYSKAALLENGERIITIAEREGLDAHARAIKARLGEGDKQ